MFCDDLFRIDGLYALFIVWENRIICRIFSPIQIEIFQKVKVFFNNFNFFWRFLFQEYSGFSTFCEQFVENSESAK